MTYGDKDWSNVSPVHFLAALNLLPVYPLRYSINLVPEFLDHAAIMSMLCHEFIDISMMRLVHSRSNNPFELVNGVRGKLIITVYEGIELLSAFV